MVLHHHEYFDGSGTPKPCGRKNPARSAYHAIADAYDTITSDRTYKKARKAGDALAELERCANAQFDGAIVEFSFNAARAAQPGHRSGDTHRPAAIPEEPVQDKRYFPSKSTSLMAQSECDRISKRPTALLLVSVLADRAV